MICKKAFVTNGLSTYGRSIISKLVDSGCHTAFSYYNTTGLDDNFVSALHEKNFDTLILPFGIDENMDLHTLKSINLAAEKMDGLDILICIPELFNHIYTPVSSTQNTLIKKTYDKIYKDTLLNIKEAALYMKDNNGGSIVIISDAAAFRAKKYDFLISSMYAALHRSIESFALQLAPYGIRINCIAPGNIKHADYDDTNDNRYKERLPLNRFGTVDDIAEAMFFLSSDKASYITGITLKCDGASYLAGMPEKNDWYGWDNKSQSL